MRKSNASGWTRSRHTTPRSPWPTTIRAGRCSSLARLLASAQRSAAAPSRSSTSVRPPVPGLAAKPIIDIVLAVPDSSDERAYVPALESAGSVLRAREPGWFEHRMFKGTDTDINLHVFTVGAAEIDRMLLFRDRLRNNDADPDAYLQVKRDLARRTWRHVQHNADAKTTIVEQIIARATQHRPAPHPG